MAVSESELAARWALALRRATDQGMMSEPEPVGERVYKTKASRGWQMLARFLASCDIGGMVIPLPNGITWRHGQTRGGNLLDATSKQTLDLLGGYVHDLNDEQKAGADRGEKYQKGARDFVSDLYGTAAIENFWTMGSLSRFLWKQIAVSGGDDYPAQRKKGDAEHTIAKNGVVLAGAGEIAYGEEADPEGEADPVGYHDCEPGVYASGTLWDCKAYYAGMLRAVAEHPLMTLRPRMDDQGGRIVIDYGDGRDDEKEILLEVLNHIDVCKPLRNCMVGTAMGSFNKILAYMSKPGGKVIIKSFAMGPGMFRRLGLMIVRTGYDLCREQSRLTESVYSTVDSVLSVDGSEPELWREYGFRTEIKHRGACEVVAFGTWAFWREGQWKPKNAKGKDAEHGFIHRTDPYRTGFVEPDRVPPPDEPNTHIYRQWL